MFWLLQKQALVSIPLALSMLLAAHNPAPRLRLQDWLGVADARCRHRRRSDSPTGSCAVSAPTRPTSGKVCDAGLWRWSRHPELFLRMARLARLSVIAIDLAGGYPWGWLALAAPVCMYWLLVHVSGIPPLEEHMLRSRGDAFRAYQARTSAFFPLPPRATAGGPT